ncbi:MAG: peptidoglycan editing factor PgeF [Alphaproteobacteria bacterium]|nr:peptidoglycan editing factor PgeF [Alphaproteobacteria bacterium]
MITLGSLDEASGIRHGFFTRAGGVSDGLYRSLNCGFGSGDAPEKVSENRARAMAALGLAPERLVTCYQIHSAEVAILEEPWRRENNPRADALVTTRRGIALGILTADCVPVLLGDPEGGVIGAAHAGWKGALGGVLEATVAAMVRLGAAPSRIHAAIGPAIAQRSYEVGAEFPGPFLAADPGNARFFMPSVREGRFMFDLGGYVEHRLRGAGIVTAERAACDTAAEEQRFFSYRRACLKGETDYGRGLSAIVLEE